MQQGAGGLAKVHGWVFGFAHYATECTDALHRASAAALQAGGQVRHRNYSALNKPQFQRPADPLTAEDWAER